MVTAVSRLASGREEQMMIEGGLALEKKMEFL